MKIHVDIDPAEFNKVIRADVSMLGDARLVVEDLIPQIEMADTKDWLEQCERWRGNYPLKYPKQGGLRAQHVLDRLDSAHAGQGVSSRRTWASTRCGPRSSADHARNRHWISSGGAGTMGFGFPAAIGAQFGIPTRRSGRWSGTAASR